MRLLFEMYLMGLRKMGQRLIIRRITVKILVSCAAVLELSSKACPVTRQLDGISTGGHS